MGTTTCGYGPVLGVADAELVQVALEAVERHLTRPRGRFAELGQDDALAVASAGVRDLIKVSGITWATAGDAVRFGARAQTALEAADPGRWLAEVTVCEASGAVDVSVRRR